MVYDNLKNICKEKHITFQEIETVAELGAGCISRWKDGKVSPNIDTLKKIANVIGVKVADLVKE
ncbi:MAG: helix-turn-helix transcriptional regulator [Clostridiaceae bacterium]|nr:helix-turn-helix transcriptional regulator [Clostridiaceae bacterium]